MTEPTTMERADPEKVGKRGGSRANAYLEELLPVGVCVWSSYVGKDESKYGVFCAPAKMHTNETESGVDVAIWCCEIQKTKGGKIRRKPTIVKDPKKGVRCFYQHFIIESDVVYDFAKALIKLSGREDYEEKKAEVRAESVDIVRQKQEDEIEQKMRMLGMIRG
ncbi:MAG: hypothetical protein M0R06_03075 [Sphaerochaeta sp.]|jgi:hypothetical protein|nr:hypothetical protein [Sphaerochaeta sp.]